MYCKISKNHPNYQIDGTPGLPPFSLYGEKSIFCDYQRDWVGRGMW